jgi:hypothetical protein
MESNTGSLKHKALESLIGSGDKWVMIALIVISGGGNWFKTQQTGSVNAEQIHRATQEIHDLYVRLNEMEDRQKQMVDGINRMEQKLEENKP